MADVVDHPYASRSSASFDGLQMENGTSFSTDLKPPQDRLPKSDTAAPRIGQYGLGWAQSIAGHDSDLRLCGRRRPVLHRQPQRRPRHHALRPGPGPPRRVPDPAREPSPSTATRSPCGSTAAPTHPSSARPASRPTPPSPGGTVGACTSSSANPQGRRSCMEIGVRAPMRLGVGG